MRYVALLRGINVGGKNAIAMKELKACFEAQGFGEVRTYINSGNVIFETDEAEVGLVDKIESCIKERFGLGIPVVVRNQEKIAQTVQKIPAEWVNDQAMRTDVLFLWDEVDRKNVLDEIRTNPDVDNLIYTPGAIIWNFDRRNYTKTKMRGFIGTRVYKLMTARNANTVRRLNSLMEQQ